MLDVFSQMTPSRSGYRYRSRDESFIGAFSHTTLISWQCNIALVQSESHNVTEVNVSSIKEALAVTS